MKLLVVAGVILGLAVGVSAQSVPTSDPAVTVVRVNAKRLATCDGLANFQAYCATCHGTDAKGMGPAARALKAPVPDLTLIVVRNGGTFPETHIQESIRGNHAGAAPHEMPDWDRILRSVSTNDQQAMLRVFNLVRYIESVQQR